MGKHDEIDFEEGDGIDFDEGDGIHSRSDEIGADAATLGLRGLDYERAATGGPALAKLLEYFSDKPVFNKEEYENALTFSGDYPTTSEMMKRAGYMDDWPNTRAGVGIAGDILTTPSTWLTMGGAALAKKAPALAKGLMVTGKAVNPIATTVGAGIKNLGTSTWRAAFRPLDHAAEAAGKKLMPSQVLMENGVASWRTRGLNDKMSKLADKLLTSRNQILEQGTAPGKSFDVERTFSEAQDYVDGLRKSHNPDIIKEAERLQAHLDEFKGKFKPIPDQVIPGQPAQNVEKYTGLVDENRRPISVNETIPGTPDRVIPGRPAAVLDPVAANEEKMLAREPISGKAYHPSGDPTIGDKYDMALSGGMQHEAEHLSHDPELLARTNEELGSLLSSKGKAFQEVVKAESKQPVGSTDVMGLLALKGMDLDPSWWVAKKAVDITKGSGVRSMVGKKMNRFGGSKVVGPMTLRTVGKTPWSLAKENKNDEDVSFEEE